MARLAICAVFKNEAPFLLEWIAYHHAVGFDHFYLYDNDSSDGGAGLIATSPLAPLVTVTYWPYRPAQLPAYQDFITHHARGQDWAAFIDIDEFVLPLDTPSVRPTLDRAVGYSAMLVHWRIFGPSNWVDRPEGLVIDNYTMRTADDFPANKHVKSIVRCADLLGVMENPHEFRLRGPTCNALGQAVPNSGIQPGTCHQGVVLNHYQTRSRQDWMEKIARGSAMFSYKGPKYAAALIDHYAEASVIEDTTIKALAPAVRALMAGEDWERPSVPSRLGSGGGEADSAVADTDARCDVRTADLARSASAVGLWQAQGDAAWEYRNKLALVFCDKGRAGTPWFAALRGGAAGLTDPTFLADPHGRIRLFPSEQEARAACEARLNELGYTDEQ